MVETTALSIIDNNESIDEISKTITNIKSGKPPKVTESLAKLNQLKPQSMEKLVKGQSGEATKAPEGKQVDEIFNRSEAIRIVWIGVCTILLVLLFLFINVLTAIVIIGSARGWLNVDSATINILASASIVQVVSVLGVALAYVFGSSKKSEDANQTQSGQGQATTDQSKIVKSIMDLKKLLKDFPEQSE